MSGIALVAEFVVIGAINVCMLILAGYTLGVIDLKSMSDYFKQAPLVSLYFLTGLGYLFGVISHTFSKPVFRYIDFLVHIEMLGKYWKAFRRDLLSEFIQTDECTELLKKQELNRHDVTWKQRDALFDILRVMGHCVYALSAEASQATLRHRSLVRLFRGAFIPLVIIGLLILQWHIFHNNSFVFIAISGLFVLVIAALCLLGYRSRLKRFSQSRIMGYLVYQHRLLNNKT